MKLTDVGQVICTRILDLRDNKRVIVKLGAPQEYPEPPDDYFCPYQIIGLGDERVRYAGGVDAFQALSLALKSIGAVLYSSTEARAGELSWLGQSDLGFPQR
jgi:hypothetical protein